jgi:hypothetical protein
MKGKQLASFFAVLLALLSGLFPAGSALAQSAGRPILTVRNYAVGPSPVRAGQEFTITIEIYNNGSRAGENTMAVFTGGDFLPVGQTGHTLWQLHINHTVQVTQKMRAPADLSSGIHQLQIDLCANDYEGNHYEFPQSIPIEVIGAAPAPVGGPPKIIVQAADTDPMPLAPGTPFTLTLRLANMGDRTATNLFVRCTSADIAVPTTGSTVTPVEDVRPGRTVTVTLPLLLSGTIDRGGRHTLDLVVEYTDYGGSSYKDDQAIGIQVDAELIQQPQIIVQQYMAVPADLTPGSPFTLTVEIANLGDAPARRVSIALGGKDGSSLAPFVLVDSGNTAYLPQLQPGEQTAIQYRLVVDASADVKSYLLPVALSYQDEQGTDIAETQRVSLMVQGRPQTVPQLVVSAYRTMPERLTPGDIFTLTIQVANVGTADAQRLSIALGGPDGAALEPFMPVGAGNVSFVGTIAGDHSVTITQKLIVDGSANAKAYSLPVALTYDHEGARETSVQRLSLIVRKQVQLQVAVYSSPDTLAVGTPAPVSLEVLNLGRHTVDIITLRGTGAQMDIETDGTPFVGPLDPGGSAPLDVTITPRQSGTVSLIVQIDYRDDLNQTQTIRQALALQVNGNSILAVPGQGPGQTEPPLKEASFSWNTLTRAIKGFLGFGS